MIVPDAKRPPSRTEVVSRCSECGAAQAVAADFPASIRSRAMPISPMAHITFRTFIELHRPQTLFIHLER